MDHLEEDDSCSGLRFYGKPRPGRILSCPEIDLEETFCQSATPSLVSIKANNARKRKPALDDGVSRRLEQFKSDWSKIEHYLDSSMDVVYQDVLTQVVQFVEQQRCTDNDLFIENLDVLPAAVTELASSTSDDRFFADLETRLSDICVVVRLEAEQCKSLHGCVRKICNAFLKSVDETDSFATSDMKISSLRHFATFYENNITRCNGEQLNGSPKKRIKRRQKEITAIKKIVIVMENFEKFERRIVDDLLKVLASYSRRLPFVLVIGVLTNCHSILSTLSTKSYAALSLKVFSFQAPSKLLDLFWERVALFNDEIAFKMHPRLMKLLFDRFMSEDFSMALLKKCLRLAVLEHYLKQPASLIACIDKNREKFKELGSDCIAPFLDSVPSFKKICKNALTSEIPKKMMEASDDLKLYLKCYKPVLEMLSALIADEPDLEKYAMCLRDLHKTIQVHDEFFDAVGDRSSLYSDIEKNMGTWDGDEWLYRLEGCLEVFNDFTGEDLIDIVEKLREFKSDLENLKERQAAKDKELGLVKLSDENKCKRDTPNKKMTQTQFLEQNRLRREETRKHDVFNQDKIRILKYFRETFGDCLCRPDSIALFECFFEHLSQGYHHRTFANPNRSVDLTLMAPQKRFSLDKPWEDCVQLDTAFAFLALQEVAANSAASINIAEWYKGFVAKAQLNRKGVDEDERKGRFYKSAGELELVGAVKVASKRNTQRVQRIYWPGPMFNTF